MPEREPGHYDYTPEWAQKAVQLQALTARRRGTRTRTPDPANDDMRRDLKALGAEMRALRADVGSLLKSMRTLRGAGMFLALLILGALAVIVIMGASR